MRARVLVGVLMLVASGGCTTWHKAIATTPDRIDRLATDTPEMFVRDNGAPITGTACLTPLDGPARQEPGRAGPSDSGPR